MPSLVTHYLFGKNVIKLSDRDIIKTVKADLNAFNIGLQGPDIFFYDIIHTTIAGNKQLGSKMHRYSTAKYFRRFIEYVNDNKLNNNNTLRAYFYGILCHYSLDTNAHPYIYEQTGTSLKKHFELESDIDEILYYETFNNYLSHVPRRNFLNICNEDINTIAPAISYAVSETYYCDISSSYVKGTIKRACNCNALLNDKYGFKKYFINCVRKLIPQADLLSALIFHHKLPPYYNRLYVNNNFISSSPFMNYYNTALNEVVALIKHANKVFDKEEAVSNFIKHIGNKSYITGNPL